MRILVSNDDGYLAAGIVALAEALSTLAEVTVVAPDRDRSGASNSLTLKQPLYIQRHASGFISVEGTPTDCVHLALNGLLEEAPDMVVSGINAGANLGDDVHYSGTVAAAMEGRFLGVPAIAVSLNGTRWHHFDTAAAVARRLVARLKDKPLPAGTILNVNVPDLPEAELAGLQVTRLGNRHKSAPGIRATAPRGRPIYWIGPAGFEQDAGEGTDFFAVRQGLVSITPIQVDLTHHDGIDSLRRWIDTL